MNKKTDPTPPRPMSVAEVRDFVNQNDDFAFEMKVAAKIRSTLNVDVFHGASYVDPITLKPRQFDVRFRVQEDRKTLYFAVECKNVDPAFPVIVCGRPAEGKENFHDIITSRGHGSTIKASTCKSGPTLFRSGQFVGKSILKPGKGRDAEIYEGWSQALASAYDLLIEAVNKGAPFDLTNFGAVFPWLIVPNGTLWTVAFNKDGEMSEPTQSNYCRYFVGHCYDNVVNVHGSICLSHIEIMTLDGLRDMLNRLWEIQHDWDEWIPRKVRDSYEGGG